MNDKSKSVSFVGQVVGAALGAAGVAAAIALSKPENRVKVKKAITEAKSRVNLEAKKLQKKAEPLIKEAKRTVGKNPTTATPGVRPTPPAQKS